MWKQHWKLAVLVLAVQAVAIAVLWGQVDGLRADLADSREGAADLEAQLGCPADGAQVARQGLGDPQIAQRHQILLQLGQLLVGADPGHNDRQGDLGLLTAADQVGVGGGLVGGEVKEGGAQL